MEKGPLYLVFDTNVFLGGSSYYHDSLTRDHRTAIRMLQDFRQGHFGTLPALTVWIPWIVRTELVGLSSRDLSKCWQPDRTTAGQASAALDYLDPVTYEIGSCIRYQNQLEHEEANLLRTQQIDKDELVLISCFQVKAFYSRNVWLVTNDTRLSARAMRSGIGALTFSALKHAMTLKNGAESVCGDSFLEVMPIQWRHLSTGVKSAAAQALAPQPQSDPQSSSLNSSTAKDVQTERRLTLDNNFGFRRSRDFMLWICEEMYTFCRDLIRF